ncbi:hypothetical protein CBL_14544 [Carabus blaptoides fortunei]
MNKYVAQTQLSQQTDAFYKETKEFAPSMNKYMPGSRGGLNSCTAGTVMWPIFPRRRCCTMHGPVSENGCLNPASQIRRQPALLGHPAQQNSTSTAIQHTMLRSVSVCAICVCMRVLPSCAKCFNERRVSLAAQHLQAADIAPVKDGQCLTSVPYCDRRHHHEKSKHTLLQDDHLRVIL